MNIFLSDDPRAFSWDKLGNIEEGRMYLGSTMPVLLYRMQTYSLRSVLSNEFGAEKADELFRKSGHVSGQELAKNVLNLDLDFNAFIAQLSEQFIALGIGILHIEAFDEETGHFTLTVAEDLDCSGLTPTNETVCCFDEGLIAGILEVYTGKRHQVIEVDCWATGARVCRFKGTRL